MSFYEQDLNGYDLGELRREAEGISESYRLATGDMSLFVGVTLFNRYEFELWLDRDGGKTEYFNSFEDLDEFVRELFPDADWGA